MPEGAMGPTEGAIAPNAPAWLQACCTHSIQPVGADNIFCTHHILEQKHPFHHSITEN